MRHFLEVPNQGEHGEYGFHHHALVPLAPFTEFEVGGVSLTGMEARIPQDHHLVFKLLNQVVEAGIVDIGRVAIPSRHQAQVVEHQTEFSSYDPAVIGLPFLANLVLTTSLSYRMNQLDAVGVDDSQQGGFSQEGITPTLVSTQQAKETGAVGQFGEHSQAVVPKPAVESPVTHSFDGMEQTR